MFTAAVNISNVSFGYSNSSKILYDINAEIPYGKIYSLLGPSGAGKTTLLRLMLGRIRPSSGKVTVLENEAGSLNRMIGYMPQDTALCMSFTVGQTLQYFANIYRLSTSQLKKKKRELQQILGLPKDNLTIAELSGGQQKMISLSLTFLHQPQLLILDEPTVGSDPLLGDCIWKYLHQCCLNNISIIIVTHYVEEANLGHIVGIMRNGTILEQGQPKALIEKYHQRTLEDVFLHLCQEKMELSVDNFEKKILSFYEENNNNDAIITKFSEKIDEKPTMLFNIKIESSNGKAYSNLAKTLNQNSFLRNSILNIWILFVLCQKNLARFFHFNISFLIFLIPAFQALILCSLYNRDSVPVPTAIVNNEKVPYYSEMLLSSIEKVDVYYLKPIFYESLDLAMKDLNDGKIIGVVYFESNFTEALTNRVLDSENINNETIESSNVKLFMDNTNFLFANGLIDSIRQSVFRFLGKIYEQNNLTRFEAPIDLREIVYAKNSKLSDFLLPGYLISFIYLSQVSLSSQLLIQEKKDGLFERSLVSGVSHTLVFLSHFISSSILSIIQISLMLFVSLFLFQITNYGSYYLIFTLVFAQALNAVSTGLLISAIFNEGFVAILASVFVTFSQLFSSGSIFSMEFISPYLRKYLQFCPISIPTESLRNVMLRAWDISHPKVYDGLLINLLAGLVLCLMANLIFKKFS